MVSICQVRHLIYEVSPHKLDAGFYQFCNSGQISVSLSWKSTYYAELDANTAVKTALGIQSHFDNFLSRNLRVGYQFAFVYNSNHLLEQCCSQFHYAVLRLKGIIFTTSSANYSPCHGLLQQFSTRVVVFIKHRLTKAIKRHQILRALLFP